MSRLSKILFEKKPLSNTESFLTSMGLKPVVQASKTEKIILLIEDSLIDGKDAVKKGSKFSWNWTKSLRARNPFYTK